MNQFMTAQADVPVAVPNDTFSHRTHLMTRFIPTQTQAHAIVQEDKVRFNSEATGQS